MTNKFEKIEQEVSPVVRAELDIIVTDGTNYSAAAEFLKELKTAQNRVTTFFADMKKKAYDSWKQVVADENKVLNPLKRAEASIKTKMLDYDYAQKRQAEIEEKRLQKIADAKAEAERQRLIKAAEKLQTESLRDERLAEAEEIEAPVIHVQHDTPKVTGISTRTTWKARVLDKKAFVVAASIDANLLGFVSVDQTALNKLAQATKGQLDYPGIEFYSDQRMAAGSK